MKDPLLLGELHREYRGTQCWTECGRRGEQLHHIKNKPRDDTRENLAWVCRWCHGAIHGNPYWRQGERWDRARVLSELEGHNHVQ